MVKSVANLVPYVICDVFTQQQFGGNPLAVITDASGLSAEQMQKIAREFNFSESTFVLPPAEGGDARMRIFTPSREVPFAGHPNIGTAFVLTQKGILASDQPEIVIEQPAGKVVLQQRQGSHQGRFRLTAPEALSLGQTFPRELLAQALGLNLDDIVIENHLPRVASCGLAFVLVELAGEAALEKAKVVTDGFEALAATGVMPDVHAYARSEKPESDSVDVCTRMFAPHDGVPEDPATGSANCALAGMLLSCDDRLQQGQWRIDQGFKMGRPSRLYAGAIRTESGEIVASVAGDAVLVAQGQLSLQ